MKSFVYNAVRGDGTLATGQLAASSREAAVETLAGTGLFVVELHDRPGTDGHNAIPTRIMRAHDLAVGLRILATLLEAGLPMGRSLETFAALAPAGWAHSIPAIRKSIREGRGLAPALSGCGVLPVVTGIIAAGEAGSGLPQAVRRAAEHAEREAAFRSALRSALAYPALLVIAAGGAAAMMVGVVLPRFADVLAESGQSLPALTAIVLTTADWARALALPFVGLCLGGFALWRRWTALPHGKSEWHAFLLTIPVIGRIRQAAATSRVCLATASLLESGVPLAIALRHAAEASGDACVSTRVIQARADIVQGASASHALARHQAFSPAVTQLIHAGEESGQLAVMLGHAERLERESAQRAVNMAVRMLEPLLLVVFGAAIAIVAAAMLQAVYSVRVAP